MPPAGLSSAGAVSEDHGLEAVAHAELLEDPRHVGLHRSSLMTRRVAISALETARRVAAGPPEWDGVVMVGDAAAYERFPGSGRGGDG